MKPRNPKIDFVDSLPHWSPDREFSQMINGGSMALPYLEPYLNKIMTIAQKKLGHKPQIQADIGQFVAQEGHHYRQHKLYNRILVSHYPALAELEKEMKADYDRLINTKSFRFNCAYCEGFESGGIVFAQFFFEEINDLLANCDPKVERLWKWHLAEEFEHKTVCYDVYNALFGGYFMRIYGLIYATRHLGAFTRRAGQIMLAADREGMTDAELAASIRREKAFKKRQGAYMLPRLLKLFSPFYNPRKRAAPLGAEETLRSVEALAA